MKFLIKIFGYAIITISFLFLIFSTFISPQYEKIDSLKIDNRFEKYIKLNENIFIENLSNTDSIYYTNTGSYTKEIKGDQVIIKIKKGIFIFNINDLNKNYIFSYKGFILKPLSTGIFYLDTNNEKKINLFSKEITLKILFKNIDNQKVINTAFLYPHEYIIVNLKFLTPNKIIKNNKITINPPNIKNSSDFLRIKSQFFLSGYISNKIYDTNKYNDIIAKIIGKTSIDFLNNSIKDIEKKYNINYIKYRNIEKLNSWNFPGVDYIERHISYFYNPSKKIIYYKNSIIKNTLKLFSQKNTRTLILRKNIKENLILLKEINKNEYIKMLDFINYISYTLSNNKSLSTYSILEKNNLTMINDINIIRKLNFYNLKIEIYNKTKTNINLSYIYLKSTFNLYDKGELNNINKNLNYFIKLFYIDSNIKNTNGKLIYKNKYTNQIDYLGFYIKNYISYILLSNISILDSLDSLKLINNYIILNENIYFKSSNEYKIETGIREGVSFINKLNIFIRKSLFKKDRDNKGLLIKETINDSNIQNIKELSININKFNTSIENHKSLIENIQLFKKNKEKFKEYFNALLKYDSYIINYDKINKEILNINIIGTNNDSDKLTKKKFITYIKQFDGINNNSLNNLKIDIINNTYYKINSIYINGKSMSFNLYPYQGNKLNNISIYGTSINKQVYYNSTYKLDKLQRILKEKANSADIINKDRYDFKKFFLNKFFNKKKIIKNDSNKYENKIGNENRIIVIFKSTKLLGTKGEFNIIKNIVHIKYNELLVKRKGDKYNININGSLITSKAKNNKFKYGLFYSSYILDNNSHYFENMNLKLYSRYEKEKILLISGKKINFLGKINILDLEKILKKFFGNTQNIEYVYNSIYNTYINVEKLKINYDIITGQIIYNFKNNNNYIEISFKGSNIINISYNGIKKYGNGRLNNLQNILLQINN